MDERQSVINRYNNSDKRSKKLICQIVSKLSSKDFWSIIYRNNRDIKLLIETIQSIMSEKGAKFLDIYKLDGHFRILMIPRGKIDFRKMKKVVDTFIDTTNREFSPDTDMIIISSDEEWVDKTNRVIKQLNIVNSLLEEGVINKP
jgi:hypothetical protein